jgi:hypothetical protein
VAATETEHKEERKFWQLASDDKRLLYITVIGGLAANVGAVLVVGLGILEAHLIHRYRHSLLAFFGPQLAVMAA